MMVSVPAAERSPSSYPAVLTVRVIVAAIGFASTEVRVFANNSSTQENMKQKKAATPIPAAIAGLISSRKNAKKDNHQHRLSHQVLLGYLT